MSYSEKLKDPKWQQMRLKIMERDGFACRKCAAKDKTLHVHHFYYTKGAEPWEYDPSALITLCEGCHEDVEKTVNDIKAIIGIVLTSESTTIRAAQNAFSTMAYFVSHCEAAGHYHETGESFLKALAEMSIERRVKSEAVCDVQGMLIRTGLKDEFDKKVGYGWAV